MLAKALVLWVGILVLAILNGWLREELLIAAMGTVAGQVASGVILCVCVFAVAWAAIPWFGPLSSSRYLYVGLFWLALTVAFEFLFGRLFLERSWEDLFDAYLFKGGNLWPIVLLITLVAPWLAARVRGLV